MAKGWTSRLSLLSLCALLACAHEYDPARDRKIPRPPEVLTWEVEATLDATPAAVWTVLTDFDGYARWNPWLTQARATTPAGREAAPRAGDEVDVTVVLDGRARRFGHVIVQADAPHRFCWRDAGPTTAFATGMRCRELTPTADGRTHFRQVLTIGGPFRESARRRYGAELQASMEAETAALADELARTDRCRQNLGSDC